MSSFKIERKKISVEIYGNKYELSKPKFTQVVETQDQLESMSAKEKFIKIKSNLIEAGLPESVIDDMDTDDLLALLEHLNGVKKN